MVCMFPKLVVVAAPADNNLYVLLNVSPLHNNPSLRAIENPVTGVIRSGYSLDAMDNMNNTPYNESG